MPRLDLPRLLLHLTLALLTIVWLVPSFGLLVTSFRPRSEIAASGWWTMSPVEFTIQNYSQVLAAQGMGQAFWNSFLITLPATSLTVALGALAAYGFAWGGSRAAIGPS